MEREEFRGLGVPLGGFRVQGFRELEFLSGYCILCSTFFTVCRV